MEFLGLAGWVCLALLLLSAGAIKFSWDWIQPCRMNNICPLCYGEGTSRGWSEFFRWVDNIEEEIECPVCYGKGTFVAFEAWNREYRAQKDKK